MKTNPTHYQILSKISEAAIEKNIITYRIPKFCKTPFEAWSEIRKRFLFIDQLPSDYLIVPCYATGNQDDRGAIELVRDWSGAFDAQNIVFVQNQYNGDVIGEHIPLLGQICENIIAGR
jgi:hypothetical protein